MYVRTSFRGAKHAKFEKRVCFWPFHKFWKGHDRIIKKKNNQKCTFRVYFRTWKLQAWGVFWKSFCEDDIQPEIQVLPLPPGNF